MKCRVCDADLSDEATYCSECGTRVHTASEMEAASHRNVDALLAAANLHRVRSEWDDAIEQCTAVLRQEPENAPAHALLGDVYAAQDRYEEAVRWYEMALDIEPENRTYTEKLSAFRERLAEMNANSDSAESGLGWFDRFVVGGNFESSIRVITVTSAGFAGLLIAAGLIALFSQRGPEASVSGPAPRHSIIYRSGSEKPVVVESTTPGLMSERAAYEIQLLKRMNENALVVSRRVMVDDARVDPRSRVLIATFRNHDNSSDKQETLLNAGAVAAAGFSMNNQITFVTVRCVGNVLASSGRTMDLIFVADAARQSAPLLKPDATAEQLSPALQAQWWNPLAKPPTR